MYRETVGPSSPHERNIDKSKLRSFSLERWIRTFVLPFLFKIALIGLFVLFFLFKVVLLGASKFEDLQYQYEQLRKEKKQKYEPKKKRVIIIGGGYAGTHAAKKLQNEFEVTLIDAKDYYEFTPSRLRTLVEPWHTYKVKLSYESILQNTRIIIDKVQFVSEDSVTTDHQSFPYDYLIVTTGSRYIEPRFPKISTNENLPFSNVHARILSARTPNFEFYNSLVAQSKKVLVIGGGTVGVELAGEIAERYTDKEVTIIHSQKVLMNRSPLKAGVHAESYFKSNTNVSVVVGERIIEQTGVYFRTDVGTIHEADVAFICTGNIPNSELLKAGFPEHLNRYGFVKVNEHLQLTGFYNIFVAGDLTDIPEEEEKLCQTAFDEIKVVISNVKNQENGKPLQKYVPTPCPMLISLGRHDGILTYRGWTLTGFLPAVMKEFVEWKEMVWYWDWHHFKMMMKSLTSTNPTVTDHIWRAEISVV